jgi:RNA polymerase sigma factor (sigma-70 family)
MNKQIIDVRANQEESLIQQERRRILYECLAQLNERRRNVIVMHDFYGKSIGEISRALNMAENNVTTTRYHARRQLRKCLINKGVNL